MKSLRCFHCEKEVFAQSYTCDCAWTYEDLLEVQKIESESLVGYNCSKQNSSLQSNCRIGLVTPFMDYEAYQHNEIDADHGRDYWKEIFHEPGNLFKKLGLLTLMLILCPIYVLVLPIEIWRKLQKLGHHLASKGHSST